MSYVVFARKYRPQVFEDIVGQPHIVTTLKNAIAKDRVAHAYLFAGPRGVGKTTTARILAKALNCEKGPSPKPCNACASCKEITQGASLDILEIDGASNRGIDEIRNLRDNVKFAPSRGSFRIYIIDEVHMLSQEAFNALLKTLEEPPKHVIFMFATTHAHKVPPTILSRCQRFDFRRISTNDIHENLKTIAKKENLKIQAEALAAISKFADGSIRDAQVILDQIASFAEGKTIDMEGVSKILGIIDDEVLFGLSGSVHEKNPSAALKIIDSFINDGKDVTQVVLSLIEHFRNISVVKIGHDLDSLIDASVEKIKCYQDEAKKFTVEEILYVIYTLSNTLDFIKKSNISRVPLEAAMVKLTRMGPVASLNEIVERLDRLVHGPQSMVCSKETEGYRPKTVDQSPMPDARPAPEASRAGSSTTTTGELSLDDVLTSWSSVLDSIKARRISVASYLQEGYPVKLETNAVVIGFPKECQFHKDALETPENKRLIEGAIKNALSIDLKVVFQLVEPVDIKRRDNEADYGKAAVGDNRPGNREEKGDIDPIVKSALEIFSGEIAGNRIARERSR